MNIYNFFFLKIVKFTNADNKPVFEDDMRFAPTRGSRSSGVTNLNKRWPKGIVPYRFDGIFGESNYS
jgi:hypothetical protein